MNLPKAFFPLAPRVIWTAPRKGIFKGPFAFVSKTLGRITITKGFDTDYASVPRALWSVYPPDGDYSPAAWVHDYLYWYQEHNGAPIERAQADAVFLEAMQALEVGVVTRSIIYRSVRIFGGVAWESNRRARLGLPAEDPASPVHIKRHFHKLRR